MWSWKNFYYFLVLFCFHIFFQTKILHVDFFLSPKIELILPCKRCSLTTDWASKNSQKVTVNMLPPMHDQSGLVFIALLPNHFNFEDARMQRRDTSVSQMWSNSNCWGDITLWADRWLDRQRLWETIKQKGTEAWALRERTSEIWVYWAQ